MPLQNGASNPNSMQQQQQGSDLNGVPAQAMQNMQFGPLENSSGMLSALPVHVGLPLTLRPAYLTVPLHVFLYIFRCLCRATDMS